MEMSPVDDNINKIVSQVKCYWKLCSVKYHLKSFHRIFHNVWCDFNRDSEDISWSFMYVTVCVCVQVVLLW